MEHTEPAPESTTDQRRSLSGQQHLRVLYGANQGPSIFNRDDGTLLSSYGTPNFREPSATCIAWMDTLVRCLLAASLGTDKCSGIQRFAFPLDQLHSGRNKHSR